MGGKCGRGCLALGLTHVCTSTGWFSRGRWLYLSCHHPINPAVGVCWLRRSGSWGVARGEGGCLSLLMRSHEYLAGCAGKNAGGGGRGEKQRREAQPPAADKLQHLSTKRHCDEGVGEGRSRRFCSLLNSSYALRTITVLRAISCLTATPGHFCCYG